MSLSTLGSLARKLYPQTQTQTQTPSRIKSANDNTNTMKQSKGDNYATIATEPDRFMLMNKYNDSQSAMGMDTQPYQIHGRMMGWKLTTRSRRKNLFNVIDQVKLKEMGDASAYDTDYIQARQEEANRVLLRSASSYEKNLRRMVDARCRNPKHMVMIIYGQLKCILLHRAHSHISMSFLHHLFVYKFDTG